MSHQNVSESFYSRLLKDRIIILSGPVTDEIATHLISQILYLEMENPEQDIHFYINSPGGSVNAGLALYDVMNFVKCEVATYCIGMAASMGSFLLTAGAPGKRFAMPNSQILIHQPHLGNGGLGGQISDIEIHARELVKTKNKMTEFYSQHTGQKVALLAKMMERDSYLTPEEAQRLGFIDQVIASRKKTTFNKVG